MVSWRQDENFLSWQSRSGVFRSDNTKASFYAFENSPDCKEVLISVVRIGSRTSHWWTSQDGIGSNKHDLSEDRCIIDLTSFSVSLSSSRISWTKGATSGIDVSCSQLEWILSNRFLISKTFCTKNFPIFSANCFSSISGGIALQGLH